MDDPANIMIWIAVTLAFYFGSQWLYIRTGWLLLHPVLISMALIIGLLRLLNIDYVQYNQGGKFVSFFLGPSVVALGVLLYEKSETIKKSAAAISLSLIAGGITGIISVVAVARILQASPEIVSSMAPKSVTTPIAIEISARTGGIPPLTATIVILVGIFGAALGPRILKLMGITDKMAFGLAMGASAHGIGTARAVETGKLEGAVSGLAMCLNGIITALATPYLLEAMNRIWPL